MERVIVNLSGKTRRAKLQGRDYIVAPLTLIVPGVLNGSQGPLYYPPEEISKNPGVWNGVPIVVDHPTHGGQPVSARDPDVLNKQSIGQIFRSKAKGKLTAEGWFDLEAVERIDNRIFQALEAGKQIELSTGLFTDNEAAEGGATTEDGKPYSFIARNYRPDHLAILPDQIGACSVDDGCGVNVNKQNKPTKGGDSMSKLTAEARKKMIDDLVANSCCWNEADRETLNGLEDDKLGHIQAQAEKDQQREAVVNAAKKGFTDPGGNTHTYNEEKQEWESKVKEPEKKEEKELVDNKEEKPQTVEEWLKDDKTPEEVRNTFRYAQGIEAREKKALVERLTANVSEGKEALVKRLQSQSLDELQDFMALAPTPAEGAAPAPTPSYFGAAAPTGNTSDFDEDDVLPLPTMNYEEEKQTA